ncbi:MAG: cellulase family glycosylhydrolase [Nocardioides sp.]|uniref:glycoside hydrolase family 5 protein n=1 Tax=Nocardioides sp. TaxID=35761 RepID=UPI0039E55DF3
MSRRRRATRRGLLLGGAAAVVAAGGVAAYERRQQPAAAPAPVGTFALGLNVSGLEDDVPAAPTDAMLDDYAGHGVRTLRLPGRWEHFQPRVGGPLDEEYLATYLAVVSAANARGVGVVCDPLHNYGARTDDGVTRRLGESGLAVDAMADFWSRFAAATAGTAGIAGWDLMNEPYDLPGDTVADQSQVWASAAQLAITAIRETGDRLPIHVEGYRQSAAALWVDANPTLHTLSDPAGDLVFSAHCYLSRDNDGGGRPYWDQEVAAGDLVGGGALTANVGVRRITPFVDWLRTHGLRGEIGECGVGRRDSPTTTSDAGWLLALDTTLRYCRSVGLPLFAWGAGPHLIPPYPLSLEPEDGLPAPQWQVLDKYVPLPST